MKNFYTEELTQFLLELDISKYHQQKLIDDNRSIPHFMRETANPYIEFSVNPNKIAVLIGDNMKGSSDMAPSLNLAGYKVLATDRPVREGEVGMLIEKITTA